MTSNRLNNPNHFLKISVIQGQDSPRLGLLRAHREVVLNLHVSLAQSVSVKDKIR